MKALLVVAIMIGGAGAADARPLGNIVQLAAGTDHACAVLGTGDVVCWGDVEPAPVAKEPRAPLLVPGVSGAIGIAAASSGTCALLKTGEVWCWGVDWYIGRNHTTTGHGRQPPAAVTGLTDAVEVAMGIGFSGACARHRDGRVSCWGDNRYGHLGTPTKMEYQTTPVAVPGITTAVELAVGITGTCARLASGEVTCWGDGKYDTARPPALIPNITDAIGISVGQNACVLRATGQVSCWKLDSPTPQFVDAGVSDAIALRDNGVSIQCVIKKDRRLACWGTGLEGPGGVYTTTSTAIAGLTNVQQIAAGGRFACARLAGGTATCWGTNYARQLGRATANIVATPVAVRGVRGARAVAVGHSLACALTPAGAMCWGSGKPATLIANTADAEQVSVGENRACVRTRLGKVACWQVPGFGPAVIESMFASAIDLSVGDGVCVVQQDGTVKCDTGDRGWSEILDAVRVTMGASGGCAQLGTGELRCWGMRMPQPPQNRNAPKPPRTSIVAKDAKQHDANGPLLCAVYADRAACEHGVQIWEDDGVRGGSALVAIPERGLQQVAVGWAHACVRRANGGIGCWGYNHGGQLGSGRPFGDQPREQLVPVKLAAPAIDVAARENTTCAVLRGGSVACWGTNRDGQVGDGTFGNVYTVGAPVEAP